MFVLVEEVALGQATIFAIAVVKYLSYIVMYSFASPMKAFEGISGRCKLSQMSLKQHSHSVALLVISCAHLFMTTP